MNNIRELSPTQRQALKKLDNSWQSAYDLKERLDTLHALVKAGFAISRTELGYMFFPRNCTYFKLIRQENNNHEK